MDEHELLITPQGDAYFIAEKPVKANLTPYGGPKNGSYEDPVIFEEDLRTGKLIFAWNVAAHIPLNDSVVPAPTTSGHPSVGGGSAHEAKGGGKRCERARERIRLLERLDRDGRLGVARRPHAGVAGAGLDHSAHGL